MLLQGSIPPHFIERKTVEYKKAPSGAFLYFLYFL